MSEVTIPCYVDIARNNHVHLLTLLDKIILTLHYNRIISQRHSSGFCKTKVSNDLTSCITSHTNKERSCLWYYRDKLYISSPTNDYHHKIVSIYIYILFVYLYYLLNTYVSHLLIHVTCRGEMCYKKGLIWGLPPILGILFSQQMFFYLLFTW